MKFVTRAAVLHALRGGLLPSVVRASVVAGLLVLGSAAGLAQVRPTLPGFEAVGYLEDLGLRAADARRGVFQAIGPDGALWVNSSSGTQRFDGHEMVAVADLFPWAKGHALLPSLSEAGQGFHVDPQGRVWVAARAGVVVLDPSLKRLDLLAPRQWPTSRMQLFRREGQVLVIERSGVHLRALHLQGSPAGLRAHPPVVLPQVSSKLEDLLPLHVHEQGFSFVDTERQEWVEMSSQGQELRRRPVPLPLNNDWIAIPGSDEQTLLAGTSHLMLWTGKSLQPLAGPSEFKARPELGYVFNWLPAAEGRPLLLYTSGGILALDTATGRAKALNFMVGNDPEAISMIQSAGTSSANINWALIKHSASRFHIPEKGWHFLSRVVPAGQQLPDLSKIYDLAASPEGLWALFGNSDLVLYPSHPAAKPLHDAALLRTVGVVSTAGLACLSLSDGIECHTPKGERRILNRPKAYVGDGLPMLHRIDAEHIMVASQRALYKVDRRTGEWHRAVGPSPDALFPTESRGLHQAGSALPPLKSSRHLWLGGQGDKLLRWQLDDNRWDTVSLPAHPALDTSASVMVLEDLGEWVWLQSGSRLFRFHPEQQKLQQLTEVHGKRMRAARQDEQTVWFVADSDILRVDERSLTVQALDLPMSVRRKLGRGPVLLDKRLYVVTGDGLLSVDAEQPMLRRAVAAPELRLLKWLDTAQEGRISRVMPEGLQLHYTSPLEVSFTVPGLAKGDGTAYRYRLRRAGDPADLPWSELPPEQSEVVISGLGDGERVLEFSARLPYTEWVDAKVPLTFSVAPAPWQSPAAKAGYVALALLVLGVGWFIQRQRTRLKLGTAQQELVANVAEGIVLLDARERIVMSNEAARQLLSRPLGQEGCRDLEALLSDPMGGFFHPLSAIRSALRGEGHYGCELKVPLPSGVSHRELMVSFKRIRGQDDLPGCAVVLTDISERKAHEQELLRRSRYDGLTGMINRSYFSELLAEAMDKARGGGRLLAVVGIDIDHFKDVNDTHGHLVGDRLLFDLARRVNQALPPESCAARFGGDEFVMLVPVSDTPQAPQEALRMAQHLHEQLSQPWSHGTLNLVPSASMGIAFFPTHAVDLVGLYQCADLALYEAKRQGRDRTQIFTDRLLTQATRRLELSEALRHAVDRQELRLFLQAKVDARTLEVVGVEALLRWQREGEMVSPAEFIPLAEESGRIAELGAWVQEACCQWQRRRLDRGLALLPVAINASSRELETKGFCEQLRRLLERYELPAQAVEIEVTEAAMFNDRNSAIAEMKAFRALGINVVGDDFGTGYASLSYLTEFPLSGIKIDPTIIRSMTVDHRMKLLVEGLMRGVMSLGMSSVAEGIETLEQQALAREIGVEALQGWLYAKAIPADAFDAEH
ncbi:putative bifunctional diguanylate cyclase/phosphodiesterase [Ideonella paludis]|uniref:EAL domain-containing protein n=1 Tax=Ideonella paludis TaxID=1233411 RepID=A0ABS5DW25_9BURK|nr:EAL domain-containing protein [Ideonella paludis]MBQ0935353.1 EAL domain-containing protein [Ideonella paludis]